MKEKMLFVFNPCSGKGQIKNKLMEIVSIFSRAGFDITIYPTKAAMDAYERVCEADGQYDCIVCSGGDGTLNEVISAVNSYHLSRPKVGYIPTGSTNDFASTLGIPKDMCKAACAIAAGAMMSVDIGKFNDRYFNYVAAFGLFTDISYKTPQNIKNVLGHQAYILESLKSISKIESYSMVVRNGEQVIKGSFIYGMVANSESVGGIKGVSGRQVLLNDGLFEVMLVRAPKNPMELQLITTGLVTRDDDNPMIERFKTDHVIIESEEIVAWTLDGEDGRTHDRAEISVIPKAVDLIVPQKTLTANNKLRMAK